MSGTFCPGYRAYRGSFAWCDGLALLAQMMAMELLWTPQDESDSYTKDEIFMDYPELNTL